MIFDYLESLKLSKGDPSFSAIIMAAARKADTINFQKLQMCWPEIVEELRQRYNAPGGALDEYDFKYLKNMREKNE